MVTSLYTSNQVMIALVPGTAGSPIAMDQVVGGANIHLGWTQWQLRASTILVCACIGAMVSVDGTTRTNSLISAALALRLLVLLESLVSLLFPLLCRQRILALLMDCWFVLIYLRFHGSCSFLWHSFYSERY
jgi:hypothetical protein